MAISTSKFLPLLAFITTSLLLLHKASSAVSFNYPKFDSSTRDLIFQGDAAVVSSSGELQLTRVDGNGNPVGSRVGRVLHSAPVQLRDSSGRVAGFTTSFVFRITSPGSGTPADGLAFFIASPGSTIPPGSNGALLGLFANANALNNSRNEVVGFEASGNSVVAVEFDTYVNRNLGDPNHRHVGVDVNSIRSRVTKEWNFVNGDPCAVTISYDPYGKVLRVIASHFSGPRVELEYDIDLAAELPETVRVGFSAATGQYSQLNNIQSWSFFSNLGRSHVAEEDQGGYIASVV